MLPLKTMSSSPTPAPVDAPKWTDVTIAHWTIGLAIVTGLLFVATVALVVVTVWLTRTDRTRADERLRSERIEIDRRIHEEREAANDRATREHQIANATSLLQRIAELEPLLDTVPLLATETSVNPQQDAYLVCRAAVEHLKQGALSEALALHSPIGTQLYRSLVQLHVDVVKGGWRAVLTGPNFPFDEVTLRRRVELDLRRFSRHVRLCLHQLIDQGQIAPDALGPSPYTSPLVPVLGRLPVDAVGWEPDSPPPGWDADTQLDPHYPR